MRALAILLALSLVLLPTAQTFAKVELCPKSEIETNLAVVFGNGMFTSISEAHDNLRALRANVPQAVDIPVDGIDFSLAYNYNEPLVQQLWQVTQQRLASSSSDFIRYLSQLVPWPASVREKILELAADEELAAYASDSDLQIHIKTYRDYLRKGASVLVVAHSQGNLYANAAYTALASSSGGLPENWSNNFGIVSVATPATKVEGRSAPGCDSVGCYTVLREDEVMLYMRIALPDTLDWNIRSNTLPAGDDLHHSFIDTYMTLKSTRAQILDHVVAHVDQFDDLEEIVHPGVLSASLQWPYGADLDLHIYEIDGEEHVYYDYPEGAVGYLDFDSRVGGDEAENYYATCSDIRPGTYEFAVGYFDGDGPVQAELLLQAAGVWRFVTIKLPEPQGYDADLLATPVARVYIDQLGDRLYDFQYEWLAD